MANDRMRRFLVKPVVFAACLLPFALLVNGAANADLGANPLERVTDVTGQWGLRLLLLTLAMTPLRLLTGLSVWIKLRRMLGLFAFFYISLHFTTWIWLDQELRWAQMVADIAQRPYVTVGFLAWLLLIPLAVTSTQGMMRRLGRRWKRLHRLVYPIGLLAIVHYLWQVKADLLEPLVYAAVLAVLLLVRWRPHWFHPRAAASASMKSR
jgi:sulfoxide reductase heme-binding subunit YedZ